MNILITNDDGISSDGIKALEKEVEHFKKMFQTSKGTPLISGDESKVEALASEEITQEKIVKQKK